MGKARRVGAPVVGSALLLLALSACGGENLFPDFAITGTGGVHTGTLEGTVTAGVPLGGVSVILIGHDSTTTDGAGLYRFPQLPASSYSVTLRVPLNHALAPGDSATRRVQVRAGRTARVDWNLVQQGTGP